MTKWRALTPRLSHRWVALGAGVGTQAMLRPLRRVEWEPVRIALLSPYSWTYPGGVTRHIEALAAELAAGGHEAAHPRAVRPRRRAVAAPAPRRASAAACGAEDFVSLGRTVGLPANGAVSNMALTPHAVLRHARGAAQRRLRRRCTSTSRSCRSSRWDALCSAGELPLVGTFHTYSENMLTNGIAAVPLGGRRRMNRLHARIAVSEAAAWTARRFYGGRYRIVPNGVHLPDATRSRTPTGEGASDAETASPAAQLRILFIGQAVERKGLPILLQAFEALRDQIPATLTLVGASAEEVAHMMLDDRGVHALGKVSEERKLAELARAEVLCAPSLRRRELRHGAHRGVRRRHARGRLRHPRLPRRPA